MFFFFFFWRDIIGAMVSIRELREHHMEGGYSENVNLQIEDVRYS